MDWNSLKILACPRCGAGLRVESEAAAAEIDEGRLSCGTGHPYAIRAGVPSFLEGPERVQGGLSSREIADSFSIEWKHFDYESGRTWHEAVDDRVELFLREIDLDRHQLAGALVLDAGCGNGTLSAGIADLGCDVVATDVSDSVFEAHRLLASGHERSLHFVQADLHELPICPGEVDVVYSSGVLHHNPDTYEAFAALTKWLKPGGRMYVWLYHREPGLHFRLQLALRSLLAPLPVGLKKAFVYGWSAQSMARQGLRGRLGSNDPEDRLTWRERVVDLMDIYTPRYRWMHTPDEVREWYVGMGFEKVRVTETRKWGFGMLGEVPATGLHPTGPSMPPHGDS